MVDGELVEREKAKQAYDKIVDEMQDPALLEWEEGNQFKLRVFPIEPKQSKRVVLRYLSPLHRGAGGPEYIYSTAAPAMQERIPSFKLDFDGRTVADERDFAPGRELVVPIAAPLPGPVLSESRKDGVYLAARVEPDWSQVAAPRAPVGPRRVVLLVDTSRSALESRALAIDSVRAILGELKPTDELRLAACDIVCRDQTSAFVAATPAAVARALEFIGRVDFDGATDLGLAFRHGVELARRGAQLVYLGDGTATWGVTAPDKLRALTDELFGKTPLFVVALGKGASVPLLAAIAGSSGGRVARPRALVDVRRFALFLAHEGELPRLRGAHVATDEGHEVYPQGVTTLYPGDGLEVAIRTAPDKTPPRTLTLAGDDASRVLSLDGAAAAPHIARRWATARIAELEQAGHHDDEVVRVSLDYGVMSRKTSFLVLESDEMYARFKIERRQKEEAERQVKVTGGDLESVAGERASLSPDQIQPGDPEIRVPAPRDARSVVVVFPSGETKVASYEPELGAWTVRFLIDPSTPDGTYEVLVRITHATGDVELLRLSYVVDTAAPLVKVTMRRLADGVYEIRARQLVTERDLDQLRVEGVGARPKLTPRRAQIVADVRRVEVHLPDGAELSLHSTGDEFRGVWQPSAPVSSVDGAIKLRVSAVDLALNQRVTDVEVTPVE
jgi:Ca-activated chloride channel family protein